MPIGLPEFIENQENRCPVIFVLDTSGSMQGAPITALNEGIKTCKIGEVIALPPVTSWGQITT